MNPTRYRFPNRLRVGDAVLTRGGLYGTVWNRWGRTLIDVRIRGTRLEETWLARDLRPVRDVLVGGRGVGA
jgi:preprotein translocase subunit YajC